MAVLYVVPRIYLGQFRAELKGELALTISGLAARILKEHRVPYKEDAILQEVIIWQVVQENIATLQFFGPIAHFPGFVQELKWLFGQVDSGEDLLGRLDPRGLAEFELLHGNYHRLLDEHGLMDGPAQLHKAAQLSSERLVMPGIERLELRGLGELSPLERTFVGSVAAQRPVVVTQPPSAQPVLEVWKTNDPYAEVELIGKKLRADLQEGIPVAKLGVAFPNTTQYLPILHAVFGRLKVPWQVPLTSLRNTPVGKAILILLAAELDGWQKHHLQLLSAPGWGFPFVLNGDEQRLLYLAPPLQGLPAWRQYLGEAPGWTKVLDQVAELTGRLEPGPLQDYGHWLETLLDQLQPESWVPPQENLEGWAELVKAWNGARGIAESLGDYSWEITPRQFLRLLQALFDNYQIEARRVFAEQVRVVSVEQLGAYGYERLYAGGLVEGQFPRHKQAHWLTKLKSSVDRRELYKRLTTSARRVTLLYPEVDREGQLNLPATILPLAAAKSEPVQSDPGGQPSLFLGQGSLRGEALLAILRQRILEQGLSVSQLNRYANCPYQFFCAHILGLIPAEEVSLDLDARDHGIIIHDVLNAFWSRYLKGPLPDPERAQAELEGLLRSNYADRGAVPSPLLLRTMRQFISRDVEQATGEFRPGYLEKWFQGVFVDTPWGAVEIRGRIDRIDLGAGGEYVLYDYKTGTAPSVSQMLAGTDIQIACYLLAAQTILPQSCNVGAAYYLTGTAKRMGIFRADFGRVLGVSRGKNLLPAEDFAEQNGKFRGLVGGLVEQMLLGEFPIRPQNSRICKYCAFQGLCRKEVEL